MYYLIKLVLVYEISENTERVRNHNANIIYLVIYASYRMSDEYASLGLQIMKYIKRFTVSFLRIAYFFPELEI